MALFVCLFGLGFFFFSLVYPKEKAVFGMSASSSITIIINSHLLEGQKMDSKVDN